MLSKRISSIHMFIVSEMTENPTAKYKKCWFRASLLIICGFESVVVSVSHNLAVLPRTFLKNNKTRDRPNALSAQAPRSGTKERLIVTKHNLDLMNVTNYS